MPETGRKLKSLGFQLNARGRPLKRWTIPRAAMETIVNRLKLALWSACATLLTGAAHAAEPMPTPSFPVPWQLNLQTPASPVMERMYAFHTELLWITTAISLFVLALLVICIVRFNERANPVPSKTTHNTLLEVIWTAIPVLILVAIAVPSYRLLYYADRVSDADMTLKVTGNQWYWSYEYPDSDISFDSVPIPDDKIDASKGEHRLLETDNHVVLPIDTNVRILVTGADVIHSWAVPAFGVKTDTIPGRTNESWVRPTVLGRFYGQCSELCGVDHSFMPITVDVVSKEDFAKWVASKKQSASAASSTQYASAQN
jgi:cytochrome c oxidase subunit 2